jgi:protein SCO1/2
MNRVRLALATAGACLLAAGIGLYAARGGDSPSATGQFAGATRPPAIPPTRFALRDQDGRAVTAAALRGRPAIVSFLYTTCRDTCPLIADQVRGALDQLDRDRVPYVAVSVDPANDTPARAKSFLLKHGLTGRARFLLGSRAQLEPVWRQFGVQPQLGPNRDHTPSTVLLDERGVQRVGFMADQITPEGVAHDVRALNND